MPSGQASGPDRVYEKLCHDIIQYLQASKGLVPYERDGVDVAFPLYGVNVTFDAMLRDGQKRQFLAIECKRYGKNSPIKLRDVYAFWGEVEALRAYLRRSLENAEVEVQGVFITRSRYQKGAIKTALALDIEIYTCEQDQSSQAFAITRFRLGPSNLVAKDVIIKVPPASYKLTGGSATFIVHCDGKPE